MRTGADVISCDRVAGFYRGGCCACIAVVAHGIHRDDGLSDAIAASYRVRDAPRGALLAARSGRAYAAPRASRHRLPVCHGAIREPRTCRQEESVRNIDLRFTHGAL